MARAPKVTLSDRQRVILEQWCRNKADTPARLVERCTIILLSAARVNNEEQGLRLGVDRQRVRRWRTRWVSNEERLAAVAPRPEARASFVSLEALKQRLVDFIGTFNAVLATAFSVDLCGSRR